ncbi:MAG: DUF3298 and DUF4163 domain-containing protein, partial [Clostridiales bacterium]|nr:DUF3298 and DUF4163 domain-containing protein [Clostridiales bacterium]
SLDIEKENSDDKITVTFQKEDQSFQADDGTEILTTKCTYPIVTIQGNEEAAKKINKDIEEVVSNFNSAIDETLEMARTDYDFAKSDGEFEFYGYSIESDFELELKSSNVISFTLLDWYFTGGAHGNYGTRGITYDAATGDRITLDSLTTNAQEFQTLAGNQIEALSKTASYQERLFENYDKQTLMDSLYLENCWYLSPSGIVFFSDPYLLGPYAAGTIEFLIPYEDISILKPEYLYDGNYERKAFFKDQLEKDLNGDGKAEQILLDVTYSEEDYTATVTLSINGNVVPVDTYFDYPDQEYYLIDLDENDSYIEIAIQDYGPSDDPTTTFLRYKEDGSTILLGEITDLWSSSNSQLLENGLLQGSSRLSILQTWFAPAIWKLNGDKLEKVDEEMYYPYENSMTDNQILKNITVYDEMDKASKATILTSEDGPIRFIATDNKNWIQLQTQDDRSFYLFVNDYSKIESEGTLYEATEVFDSLIIAD